MKSSSVSLAKSLALISMALSFEACKGDKEMPKLEQLYKSKACDSGQHFDGPTLSCVANVEPIAVTGFDAYNDVDFNGRDTALQTFISDYIAANAPDYTLSVAPTCTETFEYNTNMNGGFYAGPHFNSFECAFTLSKGDEAVLTFERQDPYTDVAPAEGEDAPEYKNPVLKIVQSLDTNKAKLLICNYEAVGPIAITQEKDGLYVPGTNTSEALFPTLTSCSDFGTSITVPSELADLPEGLQAFPSSFNAFLSGEQTKYEIAGEKIYIYAANHAVLVKKLAVTCDTTTYTFDVALTPDPITAVTGTVAVSGADLATFFDVSDIKDSKFTYTKARSLFGCTDTECTSSEKTKITYKFFGTRLIIENGGTRDIWKIGAGDTATFAEPGPANVAPACAYTYTLQAVQ